MGKRELILVLAFLVLGALVYQVTKPARESDDTGRSWSDVLRNVRGEMFGSRARVAIDRSLTASVGPGVKVIDLGSVAGQVTVIGEDREDIEATMRISLLGENEADAKAAAGELAVKTAEKDDRLTLSFEHRDTWRLGQGRTVADLKMRVPERLLVQVDGRGTVEVSGTAGAKLVIVRGNATLKDLSGPVTGEFRDGSLEVSGATEVDVETRRVSLRLADVTGDIDIEAVDGQLRAADLPGPIVLDVRRLMIDLDRIAGKVVLKGGDGRAEMRDLAGPLTVEVQRMGISASMDQAVEVDVDVSDAPLEFTLPPGGITLDVEATEGSLQAVDDLPKQVREGNVERLKGEVNGGGPTVRLHGTRSTVVVKTP